jgi:modulator of FtsH protease
MYGNVSTRARMGATEAMARGIPAELTTFVKKTYGMLAFSLFLGAAACWGMMELFPLRIVETSRGPSITTTFPSWGIWLLWGGAFAFTIMGNMARSGTRSGEASPLGLVALVGMVLCIGAMLGPTIGIYVGLGMADVVLAAAVTTAVTFTGLTAVVFLTGRNFGFMGKFLFMAMLAFLVAWLVGIFFAGPGFQFWMAAVGAILFCGFILYDTSRVVHEYGPRNLVIPAVIALFLDIYNLFLMLLILMSGRRSE